MTAWVLNTFVYEDTFKKNRVSKWWLLLIFLTNEKIMIAVFNCYQIGFGTLLNSIVFLMNKNKSYFSTMKLIVYLKTR